MNDTLNLSMVPEAEAQNEALDLSMIPDAPLGNLETARKFTEDRVAMRHKLIDEPLSTAGHWLAEGARKAAKSVASTIYDMGGSALRESMHKDDVGRHYLSFDPTEKAKTNNLYQKNLDLGHDHDTAWDMAVQQTRLDRGESASAMLAQAEAGQRKWQQVDNRYQSLMDDIHTDPPHDASFIENVVKGVGAQGFRLPIMAISAPIGAAEMWAEMRGSIFDSLKDKVGVERARTAANWGSTAQMPLEYLGEMTIVKKILGAEEFNGLLKSAFHSMGVEGLTEGVQYWPEQLATLWALNPDVPIHDLVKDKLLTSDNLMGSLYSAAVGGVTGGLSTSIGGGAHALTAKAWDSYVTAKQTRVNDQRIRDLGAINGKLLRGEEVSDEEFDRFSQALNVPSLKRDIYYQTPIESDSRTRIADALSEKFGDRSKVVLEFYDSIVRSVAEHATAKEGRTVSPEEIYDKLSVENVRWKDFEQEAAAQLQPALHVSPYRFDRFSLNHVGSGEGVTAFGHGIYLAEDAAVADWYDHLSTRDGVTYNGKTFKAPTGLSGELADHVKCDRGVIDYVSQVIMHRGVRLAKQDVDQDIAYIRARLDELTESGDNHDELTQCQADLQQMTSLREAMEKLAPVGQKYLVNIPEDDQFLHWNKPLSEQPETIKDLLRSSLTELVGNRSIKDPAAVSQILDALDAPEGMTGGEAYQTLADLFGSTSDLAGTPVHDSDERAASEYLSSIGISGLKYLDGNSRESGSGKHNFVVFDADSLQILDTFYQSLDDDSETYNAGPVYYQHYDIPEWQQKAEKWMAKQGFDSDQITKYIRGVDGQMATLASLAAQNADLLPTSAPEKKSWWKKGPPRPNEDKLYVFSLDLTAMCVKRLEYAEVVKAVMEGKGSQALTVDEDLGLKLIMRQEGHTAPCLYCYVESKRANAAELLGKAMESLTDKSKPNPYDKVVELASKALSRHEAELTKADAERRAQIETRIAKDKKDLATARQKQQDFDALRNNTSISPADIDLNYFLDPVTQAEAEDDPNHPSNVFKPEYAYLKSQYGGAKANIPKAYQSYAGQLLDVPQKWVDYVNRSAGLRIFSSSDFQIEHVLDLMQACYDMQLRGLKAHAYTKVEDFVRIFGNTGIKINCSVFPKIDAAGNLELDDHGNLIEDAWMGMSWESARKFRDQYQDVGVIMVCPTDESINWALDQDWIDQVIPFHASGMTAKHFGQLGWQNLVQGEHHKWLDKPKQTKNLKAGRVTRVRDRFPIMTGKKDPVPTVLMSDYINTNKGIDRKAASKQYLEYCDKQCLVPVFPQFVDHPNYMKLRADFARTDSPHRVVSPDFDKQLAHDLFDQWAKDGGSDTAADPELVQHILKTFDDAAAAGSNVVDYVMAKERAAAEVAPKRAAFFDANSTGGSHYQPAATSKRFEAKGALSSPSAGNYLISFFEKADVSTAIHESGHALLGLMNEYSPEDFNETCKWLGVDPDKMYGDMSSMNPETRAAIRAAHEKFAKGFEKYCMDGKAPTFRLQKVFSTLKGWLLNIYKSLRGFDDIEISPEMRAIFDRWVSTAAERENDPVREMDGWWNVVEILGVDSRQTAEKEYESWESIQAEALRLMYEDGDRGKVRARISRDRKADFTRSAATMIREDKFYSSLTELRKQGGFNEESLLGARDWTKDEITFLRKHRLMSTGGKAQPNVFSLERGFESAEDFIDACFDGRPLAIGAAIKERAASMLNEWQHSVGEDWENTKDLETQLNLEVDIIESILKRKAPVNLLKARDIKKLTGQITTEEYQALKRQFRELEQACKAAWLAGKKTGDSKHADEILKLKSRQQFIVERLKAYNQTRFEMDKIRRRLWDVARNKKLLADYRDQIHHLLAQYRLGSMQMQPEYAKLPSLETFIRTTCLDDTTRKIGEDLLEALWGNSEKGFDGYPPRVDPTGEKIHQAHWTKGELEAVDAMCSFLRKQSSDLRYMQSNEFTGKVTEVCDSARKRRGGFGGNSPRQERKYLGTIATQRDDGTWVIEEPQGPLGPAVIATGKTKKECVNAAMEHYREPVTAQDQIWTPGDVDIFEKPSKWEQVLWWKDHFIPSTLKMVTIARKLDGYQDMGPAWSAIVQPINKALRQELALTHDCHTRLQQLFAPFLDDKNWATKKYKAPNIKKMLTKEQIIMVALNSGNEGNVNALLGGFLGIPREILKDKSTDITQLAEQYIDPITALLDDKEKQLVKDIWSMLDEFYQPLNEIHRELAGCNLPRVEGHYFPLSFDPRLSRKGAKIEDIRSLEDMSYSPFFVKAPKASHRQSRTGGMMPLRLEFGVIGQHIQDCCHDITHSIPVRDVARLTGSKEFTSTLIQLLGEPTYDQIKPWLSNVARPNRGARSVIEKILAKVRRNTSVVALGYNFGVASMQTIGLTQSAHELGRLRMAHALIEYYGSPAEMSAFIQSKSIMMKHRADNLDRDMNALAMKLSGELTEQLHSSILEHSFWMIGMMDRIVSEPTWIAAYRKGLTEFKDADGNPDEDKAIEYADDVVERTQAAGAPKDQASIQTGMAGKSVAEGAELIKLGTMFYSSMSGVLQRVVETIDRAELGQYTAADVFKSYWLQILIPAALSVVIKGALHGELPDDPAEALEEVFTEQAGYLAGTLPFVRDFLSPLLTGFDWRYSPAFEGIASMSKFLYYSSRAAMDAVNPNEEADWRNVGKYGLKSAGYFYGLPTNQAQVSLDGAIDIISGETQNPLRLIARGPRKED